MGTDQIGEVLTRAFKDLHMTQRPLLVTIQLDKVTGNIVTTYHPSFTPAENRNALAGMITEAMHALASQLAELGMEVELDAGALRH